MSDWKLCIAPLMHEQLHVNNCVMLWFEPCCLHTACRMAGRRHLEKCHFSTQVLLKKSFMVSFRLRLDLRLGIKWIKWISISKYVNGRLFIRKVRQRCLRVRACVRASVCVFIPRLRNVLLGFSLYFLSFDPASILSMADQTLLEFFDSDSLIFFRCRPDWQIFTRLKRLYWIETHLKPS